MKPTSAIVRPAEADYSEAEILKAMKALKRGWVLDKLAYGVWLGRLKAKVGYGLWEETCHKISMSVRTADRWIAKSAQPEPVADDFAGLERQDQGFSSLDTSVRTKNDENPQTSASQPPTNSTPQSSNSNSQAPSQGPIDVSQPMGAAGLYCRDCRIGGVKPNCKKCIAFRRSKANLFDQNVPPPLPPASDPPSETPAKPLVDEDGEPIPEPLQAVWTEARETIKAFARQLRDAGKNIAGVVERPGCASVPAKHIRTKIHALNLEVWSYRPAFVCDGCKGSGCEKCHKEGLRSSAVVRGERAAIKAKEWHARHGSDR